MRHPGAQAGGSLQAGRRTCRDAHLPTVKPDLPEALGIGGKRDEWGESRCAVFTALHGTAYCTRLPAAADRDNHAALDGLDGVVQGLA